MLPAHLRYLKCIPFSYPSQNPPLKTGGLTLPPPTPYHALLGGTDRDGIGGRSVCPCLLAVFGKVVACLPAMTKR